MKKKKFITMVLVVMLIALTPSIALAATSFADDFESYAVGSYPSPAFDDVIVTGVDEISSSSGNKLFSIANVPGTGKSSNNHASFTIDPTAAKIIVEYDIKPVEGRAPGVVLFQNDGLGFGIKFANGASTRVINVKTEVNGTYSKIGNYEFDTWYNIVAVIDVVNSTMDVKINGKLLLNDAPMGLSPKRKYTVNLKIPQHKSVRSAAEFDNAIVRVRNAVSNPQTGEVMNYTWIYILLGLFAASGLIIILRKTVFSKK